MSQANALTEREREAVQDATDRVVAPQVLGVPTLPGAARALGAAFGQRAAVLREAGRLLGEVPRIVTGRSALAPAKGDRRFADPAWTSNPLHRRLLQTYLAGARGLDGVVAAYAEQADPTRAEQALFAQRVLTAAAAPTNGLVTNPAAAKRAFETGGASVVRGLRHLAGDLRHNGGLPSQADRDAFEVGRNLALSDGAVIERDEVGELLRYAPQTKQVREVPLLIIPPPIGRFYFLDLQPGRSFVEFASARGQQVFLLSWRNPDVGQADWDLDTYARRIVQAIDEVCAATGSDKVNLLSLCAGGILSTTVLNHLAAIGDDRVASMSSIVMLLDFQERAAVSAFAAKPLLSFARRRSERAGVIRGQDLGAAFTWMRPDELVFNYVVNNYLMGNRPPAFDILSWNVDSTNLPARLHRQFLDIFEGNLLQRPGGYTVLGSPVDLSTIKTPLFVVGAVTDHLTPWRGCYRTTQLVGGPTEFVLSYSGHVASLVNPPGNPKAHYWTGPAPGADPDAWLAEATRQEGTWWEGWATWIGERSGHLMPAQTNDDLGLASLGAAPGLYVRDLVPEPVNGRAGASGARR